MISVTRLNGSRFLVNSDLIERVDETPDTVMTLVDGTRYLVSESLENLLSQIRTHRAAILAQATEIQTGSAATPDLRIVTNDGEV